jgi:hypothetical protein
MDSKELALILLDKKEYGAFSVHKLEKVGEKYDCTLKEPAYRGKNPFYYYPARGLDTELEAMETAVIHVIKTGGLTEIVSREKTNEEELVKKKKKEKVIKKDEETPESSI